MTAGRRAAGAARRAAGAPRWQDPELDEAALVVARRTRDVLDALRPLDQQRWLTFLEPLVPAFEDGDRVDLQAAARRARAAFGARDSLLDAGVEQALPLRDAVDRLLLLLDRRRAAGA